MITILHDRLGVLPPPPQAVIARETEDYVAVRRAVRVALDLGQSLTVVVRDPQVSRALADLRTYPAALVVWREVDPCADYRARFGAAPDPRLDAAALVALELAQVAPLAHGDGLAALAAHHAGPLWGAVALPEAALPQLLRQILDDPPPPPPVRLVMRLQCERWAQHIPACRVLADEPGEPARGARRLLQHAALHRYAADWLATQQLAGLPVIAPGSLADLLTAALEPLDAAITDYWAARSAGADWLAGALTVMSGASAAEFRAVNHWCDRHPAALDDAAVAAIERCFGSNRFRMPVAALRNRIQPPAVPFASLDDHTDASVLDWATRSYLPRFRWLLRHGADRQALLADAEAFAEWLLERYPKWLHQERAPLVVAQWQQVRDALAEPDTLVIWVVLDALCWWHGDLLAAACLEHGLQTDRPITPLVAMLPSVTSISKRALLTGVPEPSLRERSIIADAEETFRRKQIAVQIDRQIMPLVAAIQAQPALRGVVWLDNRIDTLAHVTSGPTDGDSFIGVLREIAGSIRQLCDAAAAVGRHARVIIGSDHGGTRLPADARLRQPPVPNQNPADHWHDPADEPSPLCDRAIIVEGARPTVDAGWHLLEAERFLLPWHVLVPRGAAYVGARRAGWTHGGLWPEEVLVPQIVLGTRASAHRPPVLRLSGAPSTIDSTTLMVELENLDAGALEAITLVLDGLLRAPLPSVPGGSHMHHAVVVPRCRSAAATIDWWLEYWYLGDAQRVPGPAPLAVRRLHHDDGGFDAMFGDG
jgi:hypothetical protein